MAPLTNAEEKYNQLLKSPSDVTIDATKAAVIWKIFKGFPISPASVQRFEYRAFLQAALMAAIDGSNVMGSVETLFRSAYKPDATAKEIIKEVVKDALKRYYRTHIKGEDPPLYNTVIVSIAYNCSTYFDSIRNGLDI